ELLIWMADGKAPKPVIGTGDAAAKKACREAWQTWWDAGRTTYSLAHLAKKAEPPGLYLMSSERIAIEDPCAQKIMGSDRSPCRWMIPRGSFRRVEQFLPGDRWLIIEGMRSFAKGPPRMITCVVERGAEGQQMWNCGLPWKQFLSDGRYPGVCRRVGGTYT